MELFNTLACTIGSGASAVTIADPIVNIFKFLITLIKVGVPVLLVIWGSWDLGKAVMAQKEDEIKNAQKLFIKKLIVAVCVFLVPTFIGIALDVVNQQSDSDVAKAKSCFNIIF